MEETTPNLNEEVQTPSTQDESPQDSPQEDTQPSTQVQDTPQDSTPQEEEASEESQTEEQRPPSRRETLRIQQILAKRAEADSAPEEKSNAMDYREQLSADDETLKRLEDDRRAEGERQYNRGLEEAKRLKWETSLEIDTPKVSSKFPQLDKDSPDFHPAVADAVNNFYLNAVGYDRRTGRVANPGIRYSDFVEGYMELVEETAAIKSAESSKNIARQTARTGLRPDGSSTKRLDLNKAPSEMTNEELQAVLGQAGLQTKK